MLLRLALLALCLLFAAGCGDSDPAEDGSDAAALRSDGGTATGEDADLILPGADASVQQAPDAAVEPPDVGSPDVLTCTPPTLASPMAVTNPPVLLVTSAALEPAFESYARFHTLTGKSAEVVTVEQICAASTCNDADPKHDTAKAIKAYLAGRSGLKYAVLGGDANKVPSREVSDAYTNALAGSYEETFLTDYYFADFSEWDSDGNGTYAEPDLDTPGYTASISVSRVPARTQAEASGYFNKLRQHYTAYDFSLVSSALFVTNVATSFSGIDIDGAWYLEADGKTASLLPEGFTIAKQYATALVDLNAGGNDVADQIAEIEAGHSLIVHNGHGSPSDLTTEADGTNNMDNAQVSALRNSLYPLYLSCACDAGRIDQDSAGIRFVLNAQGGGIAYLGNTTVGLGLAGSAQMVDEVLRYIQSTSAAGGTAWLADALQQAHANLPTDDTFTIPYIGLPVTVMDESSWDWSQKASVMLGDAVLPVWTEARLAPPAITAHKAEDCTATELTFTIAPASTGTLRFYAAGHYYQVALTGQSSVKVAIEGDPASVQVGFESPQTLYGYYDLTL